MFFIQINDTHALFVALHLKDPEICFYEAVHNVLKLIII